MDEVVGGDAGGGLEVGALGVGDREEAGLGPALVGDAEQLGRLLAALLAAMPTEAVMGLPFNGATQPIDDVWDEIEAECARLVASGRVNGAQP